MDCLDLLQSKMVEKKVKVETTEQEVNWGKYFWPIANMLVVFLLLYLIVFPYVQAEVKTWLHSDYHNDLAAFCENQESLREVKIIHLHNHRNEIKFYCLFPEKDKNQEVIIHKTSGQWRAFSRRDLNEQRSFFWPIYF